MQFPISCVNEGIFVKSSTFVLYYLKIGAKKLISMMEILYKDHKTFQKQDLEELFLSVQWSSGHYADKLVVAMQNSSTVFSAWDGNKLAGLINVLDDGIMTAYVHYLLVNPDYQKQGIGKNLVQLVNEKYKDYLRILLIAYEGETAFYESCGFQIGEQKVPMFITSLWT
jgi:ribosomal protein S18 acetylase RimI-like enzyme